MFAIFKVWWYARKLRSRNEWVRQDAAKKLGQVGSRWATPSLIRALTDDAEKVRCAAVEALGQIGSRRAVKPLIKALTDPSIALRNAAVEALGKLGDRRAVEPLIRALNDNICKGSKLDDHSWLVRLAAVKALGELGDRRAVEPLIKALQEEDTYVRCAAAKALGQIGDRRAVEPLIIALADDNTTNRHIVARALEKLGERKWQAIVKGDDGDWDRLGACGDQRGFETLMQACRKGIIGAIIVLGKLGNPRAVDALIDVLRRNRSSDWNSGISVAAIQALIKIGDRRAVVPLIEALTGSNDVRRAAAKALGELGDPQAVEPLTRTLADTDSTVRRAAVEALGKLGGARVVEPLIQALTDKNSTIRRAAAKALGELGDPQAVEPLIKALADDVSDVRVAVAEALGKLGDRRAVAPLVKALADGTRDGRLAMVAALERLGEPKWKEFIKGDRQDWARLGACDDPRAAELKEKLHAYYEEYLPERLRELRSYLRKYREGENIPGGFDTSDIGDYVKCIGEVAELGTEEAISVLKQIEATPCYAEIAIAVGNALRRLGKQAQAKPPYEPRELTPNYRSKHVTEAFAAELRKGIENLPLSNPGDFKDYGGRWLGGCRLCKSKENAFAYVISFLKEMEETASGFHGLEIETRRGSVGVIFFFYLRGEEFFNGMTVYRISDDEYIAEERAR